MSNPDLRQQLEQTIEKLWSNMCKITEDVRVLTEKYGMEAIDGLSNPSVEQILEITEQLDGICGNVLKIIDGNVVKEYVDTRLLLNARQMYLHFQQMVVAYKASNVGDFLLARDFLKQQGHF